MTDDTGDKKQSFTVFVNGETLPDVKTFHVIVPALPDGVKNNTLCFKPGRPAYLVLDAHDYLLVATRQKPTIDHADNVTNIRFDIAESVESSILDNAEIWRTMAGVKYDR